MAGRSLSLQGGSSSDALASRSAASPESSSNKSDLSDMGYDGSDKDSAYCSVCTDDLEAALAAFDGVQSDDPSASEPGEQEVEPEAVPEHVPLRASDHTLCKAPAHCRAGTNPPEFAIRVGELGIVRYYATKKQMVAQCTGLGHHRCFLTKSTEPSEAAKRVGQGRPLAFLLAWLMCPPGTGRDSHVHEFVPSFAARAECRVFLESQRATNDEVRGMLGRERELRPGEGNEPEDVP